MKTSGCITPELINFCLSATVGIHIYQTETKIPFSFLVSSKSNHFLFRQPEQEPQQFRPVHQSPAMESSSENKLETITKTSNDTIKYNRKRSRSLTDGGNKVKMLLGLGFWMQGFRCFPWMAVIFFLKDGLHVDPSTLQILQNSANLPMVAKPFYGLVSDSFYVFGQHRIPYIAFGGMIYMLLQNICCEL